jgi:hypothetical protein
MADEGWFEEDGTEYRPKEGGGYICIPPKKVAKKKAAKKAKK